MRLVFLRPAEDRYEDALRILEEHELDYATVPDESTGGNVVLFPLPTEGVAAVFDDLRDADVDEGSFTVLTKAELVETERFDDARQRYSSAIRSLSQTELREQVREMQWPRHTYYLGTLLSVIAATAGLLLDQPALVIGPMVIAPQVSSALSASAGVLSKDWNLLIDSVRRQTIGLVLAIVGAALFAWFVRRAGFVPTELAITRIDLVGVRLSPTFLSTTGALMAGAVGAFGYATEQSTSLVGVMIAAALIPAAGATGLGFAWGAPLLVAGAFLLLLVNILSINVGAFLTLLAMGYRIEWLEETESFRGAIGPERRRAVYAVVALLLVASVGTAFFTATNVQFDRSVNQEIDATLDQPSYRNLTVASVRSEYQGSVPTAGPTNVTVTVSRPSNDSYPDLAPTLERRIEDRTGRNVRVTIDFVDSRTADEGGG